MSKEPLEYLRHISDECLFILSVTDKDFSKDDLIQDETLKRAVLWETINCLFPNIVMC